MSASVSVRGESQEGHHPGTEKAGDRSSDRKGKMRVGPFTHTGTAPVPPQESLRSSCPALPAQGPNIGQGLLVPVVIHLQLYLEVADVGTRGGTDELPGFQIRKILSLIDVLFLGRYGHAPVRASPAFSRAAGSPFLSSFPNIMG